MLLGSENDLQLGTEQNCAWLVQQNVGVGGGGTEECGGKAGCRWWWALMFEYVIIYTAWLKMEQRDHRMDGGGWWGLYTCTRLEMEQIEWVGVGAVYMYMASN